MSTNKSRRLIKYICYFLLLLIILWFIAVALLASPNDFLYSTAPSAISETELPVTRAVDVRNSVENRVDNLPINLDTEWHAHSCLAPNYHFRDRA